MRRFILALSFVEMIALLSPAANAQSPCPPGKVCPLAQAPTKSLPPVYGTAQASPQGYSTAVYAVGSSRPRRGPIKRILGGLFKGCGG